MNSVNLLYENLIYELLATLTFFALAYLCRSLANFLEKKSIAAQANAEHAFESAAEIRGARILRVIALVLQDVALSANPVNRVALVQEAVKSVKKRIPDLLARADVDDAALSDTIGRMVDSAVKKQGAASSP